MITSVARLARFAARCSNMDKIPSIAWAFALAAAGAGALSLDTCTWLEVVAGIAIFGSGQMLCSIQGNLVGIVTFLAAIGFAFLALEAGETDLSMYLLFGGIGFAGLTMWAAVVDIFTRNELFGYQNIIVKRGALIVMIIGMAMSAAGAMAVGLALVPVGIIIVGPVLVGVLATIGASHLVALLTRPLFGFAFGAATMGGAFLVAHWGSGGGFIISIASLAISGIAAYWIGRSND
jgi:hypothetical protein